MHRLVYDDWLTWQHAMRESVYLLSFRSQNAETLVVLCADLSDVGTASLVRLLTVREGS